MCRTAKNKIQINKSIPYLEVTFENIEKQFISPWIPNNTATPFSVVNTSLLGSIKVVWLNSGAKLMRLYALSCENAFTVTTQYSSEFSWHKEMWVECTCYCGVSAHWTWYEGNFGRYCIHFSESTLFSDQLQWLYRYFILTVHQQIIPLILIFNLNSNNYSQTSYEKIHTLQLEPGHPLDWIHCSCLATIIPIITVIFKYLSIPPVLDCTKVDIT